MFQSSRAKTIAPEDARRALRMQRCEPPCPRKPLFFFPKILYFLQFTERHVWDKCSQCGGKHLSKELWARKGPWMGLSLQKVQQPGPKPLPHMQNFKQLCALPPSTVPRVEKMISIHPAYREGSFYFTMGLMTRPQNKGPLLSLL